MNWRLRNFGCIEISLIESINITEQTPSLETLPKVGVWTNESWAQIQLSSATFERVSWPRVCSVREISIHLMLHSIQSIRKWVTYMRSSKSFQPNSHPEHGRNELNFLSTYPTYLLYLSLLDLFLSFLVWLSSELLFPLLLLNPHGEGLLP